MSEPPGPRAGTGPSASPIDWETSTVSHADLERAMEQVPRGALTVAGIASALLIIGYLYIYFLIFLPRGMVS